MSVGLVTFGTASGEYAFSTPNRMHPVLEVVSRPDSPGVDLNQFPRKPEEFFVRCQVFADSEVDLQARVAEWQAAEGTVQTLYLPEGWIPYVCLLLCQKVTPDLLMVGATNGATWRQELSLRFLQTKES